MPLRLRLTITGGYKNLTSLLLKAQRMAATNAEFVAPHDEIRPLSDS